MEVIENLQIRELLDIIQEQIKIINRLIDLLEQQQQEAKAPVVVGMKTRVSQ